MFKTIWGLIKLVKSMNITITASSILIETDKNLVLSSSDGAILIHCPNSFLVLDGKTTHLNPDMRNSKEKAVNSIDKFEEELDKIEKESTNPALGEPNNMQGCITQCQEAKCERNLHSAER